MKTLSILLATAALACACSKSEPPASTTSTTVTPAAPVTTTTPAPAAVVTTTTASSDLPKECNAYLDTVNACMSKQPGAAAGMKVAMDQTRAAWSTMGADKTALANACKVATDNFAQTAKMMKC